MDLTYIMKVSLKMVNRVKICKLQHMWYACSNILSLSLSLSHTHTHMYAHMRMRMCKHTHTQIIFYFTAQILLTETVSFIRLKLFKCVCVFLVWLKDQNFFLMRVLYDDVI